MSALAQVRVIPLQLQRLFAQLLLVDQQTASTADLTDSFGWSSTEVTSLELCCVDVVLCRAGLDWMSLSVVLCVCL